MSRNRNPNRPDPATRAILMAKAEALHAEHARLVEQSNELQARIGELARARSRAWDAADGVVRGPRREPTMREMMALHDHD